MFTSHLRSYRVGQNMNTELFFCAFVNRCHVLQGTKTALRPVPTFSLRGLKFSLRTILYDWDCTSQRDYNIRSMNEAKCFNEQFTILSTFTAAYYQCFSPLWFWSGISHDYYTDTDLQINSNVQFDLQNRAAAFQNTLTKAVCVNWDTEKQFQISKSHFITMIVSPNCMLFKV